MRVCVCVIYIYMNLNIHTELSKNHIHKNCKKERETKFFVCYNTILLSPDDIYEL